MFSTQNKYKATNKFANLGNLLQLLTALLKQLLAVLLRHQIHLVHQAEDLNHNEREGRDEDNRGR